MVSKRHLPSIHLPLFRGGINYLRKRYSLADMVKRFFQVFFSTFPGSRNILLPWNFQSLVASFSTFDWGFYQLAPYWTILQVFDVNTFYSHSLDCTMHLGDHHPYRWPSSAYINDFHHWLVSKRLLTCSTLTPLFTCVEICHFQKRRPRPWVEPYITHPCFLSQTATIVSEHISSN